MKIINKIISGALITSIALQPIGALALTKTETVYSNLDSNGTPTKITVNNHLKNLDKGNIIDDADLKDILNINGEEKFNTEGRKITWKSTGKDIFYQGQTEKELPISVKLTYYLNGEEKKVEDMIGKKGEVKIKLNFTNNSYVSNKKLYTPFVITLATSLSNKENANIEVTNGKAVDTGNKNILVGLSSPGLYENLNISEFKNLDEIIIKYETTKFKLNDIYFVATPKLLEENDLNIFNKLNSLNTSLNTLQDNMNKLEEGAKVLKKGSNNLQNGSKEITTNLNKVLLAIKKLESGSTQVDNGLNEVLNELQEVKQLLDNKNIPENIQNIEKLKVGNEQALNQLQATNNSLQSNYDRLGLANFKDQESLVNFVINLPDDKKEYLFNTTNNEVIIKDLTTLKKTYEANLSLIYLLSENISANEQMITSLKELSQSVTELITKLQVGIVSLEEGTKEVTNGLTEVKSGLSQLYGGSKALTEGAKALSDGTDTLANGLTDFNKQGINTLTGYSYKINNYNKKIKELVKLSKDYSGYTSNNADKTMFIYKIK